MLGRQGKASKLADLLGSIRDPFLPLTHIGKLAKSFSDISKEDNDLAIADQTLVTAWELLCTYERSLEKKHSICWFETHPEFPLMIGGVARDRPNNTEKSMSMANLWLRIQDFDKNLSEMSPYDFEEFGKRILSWYGILDPFVSKRSGDGGIDFVGEGRLGEIIKRSYQEWTVIDACKVIFFGQAKKYEKTVIGTAELRELVGSVALFSRESYRHRHGYDQFTFPMMQPRVLLLITTSRFSLDAIHLAAEAGIILADRDQLCNMFAQREAAR